jgi:hypothetical protein
MNFLNEKIVEVLWLWSRLRSTTLDFGDRAEPRAHLKIPVTEPSRGHTLKSR